jgi:protein TonB
MNSNLRKSFALSSSIYAFCFAIFATIGIRTSECKISKATIQINTYQEKYNTHQPVANTAKTQKTSQKPDAIKQQNNHTTASKPITENTIETAKQSTDLKSQESEKKINNETPIKQSAPDDSKEYEKNNILKIRDVIAKHKRYPQIAIKMGYEGVSTVSFKLYPSGIIGDLQIIKTSGFTSLDKSSRLTIEEAAGELPKPNKVVTLVIPIEYGLN